MDELKSRIWDLLFQLGEPQPTAAIAEQLNATTDEVAEAAKDPWFEVEGDMVSVAY